MKRVIGGILCLLLLLTLGISLVPDGPNETETLSLYYPVRPEVLASGGDAMMPFVWTGVTGVSSRPRCRRRKCCVC